MPSGSDTRRGLRTLYIRLNSRWTRKVLSIALITMYKNDSSNCGRFASITFAISPVESSRDSPITRYVYGVSVPNPRSQSPWIVVGMSR